MKNFNPRTRMGCDLTLCIFLIAINDFNPRTRMGCDSRYCHLNIAFCLYFNPRTRMGCDFFFGFFFIPCCISIHAPAWGATPLQVMVVSRDTPFQSTHPHGVRLAKMRFLFQ